MKAFSTLEINDLGIFLGKPTPFPGLWVKGKSFGNEVKGKYFLMDFSREERFFAGFVWVGKRDIIFLSQVDERINSSVKNRIHKKGFGSQDGASQ